MIKPYQPNFNYLRVALGGDKADPFINALSAKVGDLGCHRFHSRKKEGQHDKWVVPDHSGLLIVDSMRVKVVIIDKELVGLSRNKKLNLSTEYTFSEKGTEENKYILKRAPFEQADVLFDFLDSLTLHHEMALEFRAPDGFLYKPELLRVVKKTNDRFVVTYQEPRCDCDLKSWNEGIDLFFVGMIRIARQLIAMRERGLSHGDAKMLNIFIKDNVFHLADYEFYMPLGVRGEKYPDYFAWDSVKATTGLVTPFSDVYSWAIAFGQSLWSDYFYDVAADRESLRTTALEKTIWKSLNAQNIIPHDIADPRNALAVLSRYAPLPRDPLRIHVLFYRFLREVIACDDANLKHYTEDADKPNTVAQVTLEQCLSFVQGQL